MLTQNPTNFAAEKFSIGFIKFIKHKKIKISAGFYNRKKIMKKIKLIKPDNLFMVFKNQKVSLLISIFSVLMFVLIYSCSKSITKEEGECLTCSTKTLTPNTYININDKQFASYKDNSIINPETFVISNYENVNVANTMKEIILNLKITNVNKDNLIALTLFYKDTINTNSIENLLGVLIYNKIDKINMATFFVKNTDNRFTLNENLSGYSSLVSKVDMYKINSIMNFNSKQLLVVIDQSNLPTISYPSVFQVKLSVALESERPKEGGGGPQTSACNGVPECTSTKEGYCVFQERQNGPVSATCYPVEDYCGGKSAVKVLETSGYITSNEQMDDLYKIRNSFLLNSKKGMQYIDDYYYSSSILKNYVTLESALELYTLFNNNFFKTFSQLNNVQFNDSILINDNNKKNLINICNLVSGKSNDERFNSILKRTVEDINRFHNKKFIDIKNDFN